MGRRFPPRAASVWLVLALASARWAPLWAAHGAPGEIVPREVVIHKDLRQDETPSEYYIVFCARKSDPRGTGHSLVVWVEQDPSSGPTSAGYGFYPGADRVILRLFWGPGVLSDEATKPPSCRRELVTHRLVVRVDRATYDRALAVRNEWLTHRRDYHLFQHNCTHFAHAVARTVFDKPPEPARGERPSGYISRLMELTR